MSPPLPFTPILVAGAPRSGTSCLHALICTSSRTNPYTPEYHYLNWLMEALFKTTANFSPSSNSTFTTKKELIRHHFVLVRATLSESWRQLGSPEYLVVKHCNLTPVLSLLASHIPEMRFVVILRDARDVVASVVSVARKTENQPDILPTSMIDDAVYRYNFYYGHVIKGASTYLAGRLLPVVYEEIARGVGMDRLSRFLGLSDIDPAKLWKRATFDIHDYAEGAMFSDLWGQPMSGTNIGGFRTVLPDEVSEKVLRETAHTMSAFSHLFDGLL